ncbi:hypothetical protein BRYFOR_05186 [Marvinbryantia formatexigens DSM 14469]|uniref:Uncharacterized protein n=1 Tax=Marvinbryantia formatexigens DSM 14469 TaxID=478749 RepID=C6L996_9FIRM|nr:hypothetical protein BRYFOR_05186 [Marvinbryantia formatexigens DSM 14469]
MLIQRSDSEWIFQVTEPYSQIITYRTCHRHTRRLRMPVPGTA